MGNRIHISYQRAFFHNRFHFYAPMQCENLGSRVAAATRFQYWSTPDNNTSLPDTNAGQNVFGFLHETTWLQSIGEWREFFTKISTNCRLAVGNVPRSTHSVFSTNPNYVGGG